MGMNERKIEQLVTVTDAVFLPYWAGAQQPSLDSQDSIVQGLSGFGVTST